MLPKQASRRRLGEVTAFGIALNSSGAGNIRLVVYAPVQKSPAYVSEPIQVSNEENPSVRWFAPCDMQSLPAATRHCSTMFVQSWLQTDQSLIHDTLVLDLRELTPRTVEMSQVKPLPSLWVFLDGKTYVSSPGRSTIKCQAKHIESSPTPRSIAMSLFADFSNGSQPTLSYTTLLKLKRLQECIDDANRSAYEITSEINSIVNNTAFHYREKIAQLRQKRSFLKMYLEKVRRESGALRVRSLSVSKETESHSSGLMSPPSKEHEAGHQKLTLPLSDLPQAIRTEQGRLAEVLLEIFPIEPMKRTFHFTICSLPFPSILSIAQYDPDHVGAALGFVAQVVLLLGKYLDIALPYPLQPHGSQSYICDPISTIKGSRLFPLWTKGALLYRVEYGLYLLHKDIEVLMVNRDVPVVEIKHTLANLKNLLLVVSG